MFVYVVRVQQVVKYNDCGHKDNIPIKLKIKTFQTHSVVDNKANNLINFKQRH